MKKDNTKYVSLWSGPRNVSTALMYSFAQRKDCEVFDEPFYAYYLKKTKYEHPGFQEILASMPISSLDVTNDVIFNRGERPIRFYKNMAHHFVELPWSILDGLNNIFLMRHPALVINSYSKTIENITLEDLGYDLLLEMVNYVKQKFGTVFLIDGDQIQRHPDKAIKSMCHFLKIPFDPAMLHWPKGPIKEDGVWAKYWYHQVHKSEGFSIPKAQNLSVEEKYSTLLEQCLPYYEKLKNQAIDL